MTRTQIAYHASFSSYEVGTLVTAEDRLPTESRARVEEVLTRLKPRDVVSRTSGLFVAHSAAHAKKFLLAEPNPHGARIHVYEVVVPGSMGLPMALVDRIAKSVDDPLVDEIAAEYWTPTESWKFLESVVAEMEIVGICADIDLIALALATMDYDLDRSRAMQRWPLRSSA